MASFLRVIRLFGLFSALLLPISGCNRAPSYSVAGNQISFGGVQGGSANPTAPGFADGLLGKRTVSDHEVGPMLRWQKVIRRFAKQRKTGSYACQGDDASDCPSAIWTNVVREGLDLPLRQRVERINAFFNRIPYVAAAVNWNDPAFWETPFEFMTYGGQCEDYAIAKYLALLETGVSEDNLRFLVVHDNLEALDHAITVVNVNGKALALDNRIDSVVPISYLQQRYSPYYALNGRGWWPYASSAQPTVVWQTPVNPMQFQSSFHVSRY